VNTIVDTSVWSLALRRRAEDLNQREAHLVAELSELVREGRACMVGLIRQELLSGIKSPEQYEKLRMTLRAFPDEVLNTSDYEAAAKASNACRSKGVAISVVDALICAVANSRDWTIFTTDPDFRNYETVLPIKHHTARK
jgi:predicted nucleic acid-binding protein